LVADQAGSFILLSLAVRIEVDQTTSRIKAFFGTTENAVKTQIWIAVSVYVLIAIVEKSLNLSTTLYELLQILSLTVFERVPLI
jgi:hypothetical protein